MNMKNIFLVLFTLLITTAFAQRHRGNGEIKWLNISVKGGYGGTMLFNSDVSGDGQVTQDFLSPSYEFGGRFAIGYGVSYFKFSFALKPILPSDFMSHKNSVSNSPSLISEISSRCSSQSSPNDRFTCNPIFVL